MLRNMGRPTGRADLPLHGGRVPRWLGERMQALGRVVVEAIVHEYGRDELLRRLAHPFWFQSFGAVMGMDWHSSGITTSVMGALKRGLEPVAGELGIHVCGGRGRHSRRTPDELRSVADRVGVDGDALARTSRLVAKVDSAAVQDGFELYLHSFVVSDDGSWVVVQQGMDRGCRQARRYHWLSDTVVDYLEAPHAAIDGPPRGEILNLTDRRASASKQAQLEMIGTGPDRVLGILRRLREDRAPLFRAPDEEVLPNLRMPARHDVRPSDVVLQRLRGVLAAAAENGPQDFSHLLLSSGVGARTVAALALVAEVVHGAPSRFSDPARYSLALGGKDGHPFPVPLAVYDETIAVLRHAVERARLGNGDRLAAIRRLDQQARRLEAGARGPDVAAFLTEECRRAPERAGRTVFDRQLEAGDERSSSRRSFERCRKTARSRDQLELPGFDR